MQTEANNIVQKIDADRLPSLPHLLLPMLSICQDDNLAYDHLSAILRNDPALYLKVISACHRNHCDDAKTQTTDHLLKRLGANTLKSIAVSSATVQFFSRSSQERTAFFKQHWHHSVLCAQIAEAMATRIEYSFPQDAYAAGLLHDIGQLAMESAFPDTYTSTFAELSEDDTFHDLENETFSTTHYEVGAELLRRHGADPFLVDAVRYHHEPTDNILDAHPLVKMTHLANQLGSDDFKEEDKQVFDSAHRLLDIDRNTLLSILKQARSQTHVEAERYEIDFHSEALDVERARQISAREQFKQVQLAEQIRNIAMLDGVHQHLSRIEGTAALMQAIEQQLGILFSVDHCLLFLYDSATSRLHALASSSLRANPAELSLPLEPKRSLVSNALLEKSAVHSFDTDPSRLSVIDRQLINLCSQTGMICLPLSLGTELVGTLVLGVDNGQQRTLWKQLPLLRQFCNEIAHTISASQGRQQQNGSANHALDAALSLKVREVVHEVRNPLSIINNYLEILGYKLDADHPAQSDLHTIKNEILRVSAILERLSQPSLAAEVFAPVDINQLITDLSVMFQTSICAANHITLTLELEAGLIPLLSNANILKQIYTNLIKNAVEALPANGKIMVYTQDHVNVDGKEHIEITIADNGPGITTETLPRLFSPLQTQKGGEHAGLGLTIVKNLVNELNGSITCKSGKQGTSFHVLLPKK
jgi:putative nucleotidyltransferase with HDIG domain